ncbi:DUF3095 family protein [Flavobacteriales bacterium]|nr:DUF3095 family protein [Flavobacteriales bacterium]
MSIPISDIDNLADISRYQKINDNEILILADIENSTEAVANGAYKNINISTTQCIAALRKTCKSVCKIQHGGDGFVLVTPIDNLIKIAGVMISMRQQILEDFSLNMRCAIWNSSELDNLGVNLHYSSFTFDGGNPQWQFHSNNLGKLERLMRDGVNSVYKRSAKENPDLSGFRCDFVPISKEGGWFGCFIIDFSQTEMTERFISIRKISELIGSISHNETICPIDVQDLIWQTDRVELAKLTERTAHYRYRLNFDFIFRFFNRFGLHWNERWGSLLFNKLHKLPLSLDFIKYDGQLKFIVCVPDDRKSDFSQELNTLSNYHHFTVGSHWSSRAVITCSVDSKDGNLHFIDGEDGGFTLASKQLKKLLNP